MTQKTQSVNSASEGMQVFSLKERPERDLYLEIMQSVNEISKLESIESLCDGMLRLFLSVTQADSINFFKYDSEAEEFVLEQMIGDFENPRLVGLRLSPTQVLNDHNGGKISKQVVIEDLKPAQNWLLGADRSNPNEKYNLIHLPVMVGESVLGLVHIYNFIEVDQDLLTILVQRFSLEIDKRQRIEAAKLLNRRLNSLLDVLGEVAGTLDRNQILHLVTEKAAWLVGAERTSLFLIDPDTEDMLFQVAYQMEPGLRENKPEDNAFSINEDFSQSADFKYFNRAAITMPIRSAPLRNNHAVDKQNTLGGLMAINQHNAFFEPEDAWLLQTLANQTSTFLQVAEMYESSGELFLGAISALVAAIDAKDPYTQGHSQRVSDLAVQIATELALSDSEISDIRIGSLLHDIGKIGIPDAILLKCGKLTEDEFDIIKKHPTTGVSILSKVKLLKPMLPALAEHHERLDGSGYPNKLKGKEISLLGRIVAVADVFDAMTSERPYRGAIESSNVLAYLQENAGILFDQSCVEVLISVVECINE